MFICTQWLWLELRLQGREECHDTGILAAVGARVEEGVVLCAIEGRSVQTVPRPIFLSFFCSCADGGEKKRDQPCSRQQVLVVLDAALLSHVLFFLFGGSRALRTLLFYNSPLLQLVCFSFVCTDFLYSHMCPCGALSFARVFPTRPHTGRRHQLRLHALHMGHPILGDTTYGNADHTIPRMCLHAQSLQLQLSLPSSASNTSTAASSAEPPAPPAAAAAAATEVSATERARRGKRYWGRQVVKPAAAGVVGTGKSPEVLLDVVAPDPFVFVEGELQL